MSLDKDRQSSTKIETYRDSSDSKKDGIAGYLASLSDQVRVRVR
jgi:hypothetical protein